MMSPSNENQQLMQQGIEQGMQKVGAMSEEDASIQRQLDESTLKFIGIEGRKNVKGKFNIEKMCFSTCSEYKKLIN